jgi:hypothetical protein
MPSEKRDAANVKQKIIETETVKSVVVTTQKLTICELDTMLFIIFHQFYT